MPAQADSPAAPITGAAAVSCTIRANPDRASGPTSLKMPTRLPTSSRMDPESRPTRAALRKRPSGRSRLQQDDPSTISSPAQAAADPDKAGRPRSDRNPHNHSPPTLTSTRVQIKDPLRAKRILVIDARPSSPADQALGVLNEPASRVATRPRLDQPHPQKRVRRPVLDPSHAVAVEFKGDFRPRLATERFQASNDPSDFVQVSAVDGFI